MIFQNVVMTVNFMVIFLFFAISTLATINFEHLFHKQATTKEPCLSLEVMLEVQREAKKQWDCQDEERHTFFLAWSFQS